MCARDLRFRPTRREALALGIGALVVAAVPFAASRRRRLVRRRVPLMGTIAEVAVVAGDEVRAHAAIDAAFEALDRVERTLTSFRDDSDVGRANLGAARGPVAVSAATALVVEEALRWAEASDGAFDPCLGGAASLWDVSNRREPPAEAAVRRFAGRRLHRAVEVDTFRGSPVVLWRDPDVRLDLGGIAKGYAVDLAAKALRERGFEDALVNVGGDLVALGRNAAGEPWRVGVQSPSNPDALVAEMEVSDAAVATSGDYVRYFEWRGRRYHHLLDPSTGAPRVTPEHGVTVQAATCLAADAGATAVFGMDESAAARLLAARAPGSRLVLAV